MKSITYLLPFLLAVLAAIPVIGQPVVKIDAVELLSAIPAPPATLAEAYQRSYAQATAQPNAKPHYQSATDPLIRASQESQRLMAQYYQKYPMGMPPQPQAPASRVSASQKNAMESATTELAQKLMNDPAFAQKFAQMGEAEQQAYITRALADKGIKPVDGKANTAEKPMPGLDIDWMGLCTEFNQPSFAMSRLEKQTALEQKYEGQHAAVNAWMEAEIKKLPMISFGEYGHDHDPAQVQKIKNQGLEKHRKVAENMVREAAELFSAVRQAAHKRCAPLNEAFKKVQYGQGYDFGMHYTLVLQTQSMMMMDLNSIIEDEIKFVENVSQWEKAWRDAE